MRRFFLCAVAALGLSWGYISKVGATPPAYWKTAGYTAVNEDKDINKVLQRFAQNFGVDLEISGELSGQVNEQSSAKNALAYLDRLGLSHGFSWFVFNNVLYVSPMRDNRTARVKVSPDAIAELKQAVKGLGLFEDKFGWGEIPAAGLVLVSGPQKYIELVRQSIRENAQGKVGDLTLMVFALRHAWVDDRRVKLRDREMIIPGVATLARKLLGGAGQLPSESQAIGKDSSGGGAGGMSSLLGGSNTTNLFDPKLDASITSPSQGRVRIEADISSNSLLVYDEAKRRREYMQLLARIDVPRKIVETQLLIIDIERRALAELQERWRHHARLNQRNTEILSPAQYRKFFLELRELEKSNHANILSSPSLLSLSGQPAVLDISESLSGAGSVTAAGGGTNIATAGSTPARGQVGTHLYFSARVQEGRHREEIKEPDFIALNLEIADDQIDHSARDISPHYRRTLLNTQVVVQEGHSLLLGGHHIRVSDPHSANIRERLVLLTPSVTQFRQAISVDDLLPQHSVAPR